MKNSLVLFPAQKDGLAPMFVFLKNELKHAIVWLIVA